MAGEAAGLDPTKAMMVQTLMQILTPKTQTETSTANIDPLAQMFGTQVNSANNMQAVMQAIFQRGMEENMPQMNSNSMKAGVRPESSTTQQLMTNDMMARLSQAAAMVQIEQQARAAQTAANIAQATQGRKTTSGVDISSLLPIALGAGAAYQGKKAWNSGNWEDAFKFGDFNLLEKIGLGTPKAATSASTAIDDFTKVWSGAQGAKAGTSMALDPTDVMTVGNGTNNFANMFSGGSPVSAGLSGLMTYAQTGDSHRAIGDAAINYMFPQVGMAAAIGELLGIEEITNVTNDISEFGGEVVNGVSDVAEDIVRPVGDLFEDIFGW